MLGGVISGLVKGQDEKLPRAKIHISLSELNELKAAVGKTLRDRGAGSEGAKVTANEALSAALLVALADSYQEFKPGEPATLVMTCNAQ